MRNPLIIALDVPGAKEALRLVDAIGDAASFYKVGMELYAAEGPGFVRELIGAGKDVFLDMKFYDIGETVKRATARVAELGVRFLTVHGSQAVMRAAIEGKAGAALQLLGITVLTSFDESDLQQLGYPCDPATLVDLRVRNAIEAGMDGIVCSPIEVRHLRTFMPPAMQIVTPGVRSAGASYGDQKRVATPVETLQNGSTYLVIGREVTRSEDPRGATTKILNDIRAGLQT